MMWKKFFQRINECKKKSLWFGSFCIFLTLKWTSSLSTKFFWTQKTVGLVLKSNMSYTVSICVETFKSSTRRKFSFVFAGSSDHHTYPYFIYFHFYKFLVLPVSSFPWNSINSRYFLQFLIYLPDTRYSDQPRQLQNCSKCDGS